MSRFLPTLVVVLAAVVPYLPTLDNYFAQDDFGVVSLLAGKPATYFPHWFVSTWMDDIWGFTPDEIRPFPAVTYQISAWWGAASPVANHVINIALHTANSLFVLGIARVAGRLSPGATLFAAVVFALLPMQVESVAWITGRVDSIPAFFYLGAFFLFARWRIESQNGLYVCSIVLFFCALFSKQNALTLPAALVAYDILVARRGASRFVLGPIRSLLRATLPYVPFVVLTIGYLALRYVLFGEMAREGLMTADRIRIFLEDTSAHLRRMTLGQFGLGVSTVTIAVLLSLLVIAIASVGRRFAHEAARRRAWPALYFGIVWVALGIAPTLVAGYASPRHMYLASAGWAILVGVGLDVLWHVPRPRWPRLAGTALALAALAGYAVQLGSEIRAWEVRTEVSRKAVADLEVEALAVPEGALVIAGAPRRSWAFALPFAARPPFVREDLTRRVVIVSDSLLYCCPAHRWDQDTRSALRAWLADPRRPPVVALHWEAETGALSRVSEREEPFLRQVMAYWLETPDAAALDRQIHDMLDRMVAGRR